MLAIRPDGADRVRVDASRVGRPFRPLAIRLAAISEALELAQSNRVNREPRRSPRSACRRCPAPGCASAHARLGRRRLATTSADASVPMVQIPTHEIATASLDRQLSAG